ncbi:MAG TPA: JAB domain-containing protein, partial [Chthonomonadaceae bacterium]|nr:JAB domain-containing protein [Chthonomonadaceae bacterium]
MVCHFGEVFKPAILSNAASILVAHNHPSGNPEPSPEDERVTERLHQA